MEMIRSWPTDSKSVGKGEGKAIVRDKKQAKDPRDEETAKFEAEVRRVSEWLSKDVPHYNPQQQPFKQKRQGAHRRESEKELGPQNAASDGEQITLQRE